MFQPHPHAHHTHIFAPAHVRTCEIPHILTSSANFCICMAWDAKGRVRSHVCVSVRNSFWKMCAMCMCAFRFCACDVLSNFCTLCGKNGQKKLFSILIKNYYIIFCFKTSFLFGIDCHGLDGSGLDRHGLSIACQVMDLLSLILQQQLSELHMCLIGSLTATRHAVLCVRRTAPHLAWSRWHSTDDCGLADHYLCSFSLHRELVKYVQLYSFPWQLWMNLTCSLI